MVCVDSCTAQCLKEHPQSTAFSRVRENSNSDYQLLHIYLFACLPASNNLASNGRIFIKFPTTKFFSKICRGNSNFFKNLTRITGTLHEYLCTFMIVRRWILFRMRRISEKSCRKNQNTYFTFYKLPPPENHAFLWDNVEKFGRAREVTADNTAHALFMPDN